MLSKLIDDVTQLRETLTVKTTLEIPDPIFRRAKSAAAQRGLPFREFVTQAVKEKLAASSSPRERPWVKHMGKLKHLHRETERINQLIEDRSENIDAETVSAQQEPVLLGRKLGLR